MNTSIRTATPSAARRGGFTLVEVLIIVVILGILAAMVLPQFTNAAEESRENSLKMDLHRIRTQLEIFKQQHLGQWPSLANFEAEMTLASDASRNTAAIGTPGYPFGPYLRFIPVNPHTNGSTIGDDPTPGASDWYYDETTGRFLANDSAQSQTY